MDCRAVWKSLLIRSLYFVAAICSSKLLCILLFKVKAGEGIMNEEGLGDVIASISDPAVQMQVLVFFLHASQPPHCCWGKYALADTP
jgi:hypothetical protein